VTVPLHVQIAVAHFLHLLDPKLIAEALHGFNTLQVLATRQRRTLYSTAEKAWRPIRDVIYSQICKYVLPGVDPSSPQRTCHVAIYSGKYPSISADHGSVEPGRYRVIYL